jgi:hypothetical protein
MLNSLGSDFISQYRMSICYLSLSWFLGPQVYSAIPISANGQGEQTRGRILPLQG